MHVFQPSAASARRLGEAAAIVTDHHGKTARAEADAHPGVAGGRVAGEVVECLLEGAKLLGTCFWREAPETAVGADRRAGKRGLRGKRGAEEVFRCDGRRWFGEKIPGSP